MSDLLFLAHRAPFAPDRGDRIRSHHVLRHLAARTRVHLIAFADEPADRTPPVWTAELATCTVVPRTKSRARAVVEALASGRPVSLTAFDAPAMHAAVARVVERHRIECAYAFSGQMAQYLPAVATRVMDFVDRDSAKFAAYAASAWGPKAWLLAREASRLAEDEARVAASVEAALFVSAAEAALLPGPTTQVVENGIDTRAYDPAQVHAPVVSGTAPLIVFTGQMDYPPNIEAVRWFARAILPQVRLLHPSARFAIVGRAPGAAVRTLAGDHVIVTGEVADVRPWLARADVVVAPLRIARGIQNKVLEAMAMARPVVASTAAAEGIDHAGTLVTAESEADMAAAVTALLDDPTAAATLGHAARVRVERRYGWAARLAPLDALFGLSSGVSARDAA